MMKSLLGRLRGLDRPSFFRAPAALPVAALALASAALAGCSADPLTPPCTGATCGATQNRYLYDDYPVTPPNPQPGQRVVAITYDDGPVVSPFTWNLPIAGGPAPTIEQANRARVAVIDTIMAGLRRYRAPMTLFVVGNYLKPEHGANADELMRRWRDSGVDLASHTMSHKDLNTVSLAEATNEIEQDDDLIRPYLNLYRQPLDYFRFPLLSEGETIQRRNQHYDVLRRNGLKNAVVSITNNDFAYGSAYAEAELAGDAARKAQIGREYMAHIRESIDHWDEVGVQLAGRPVRQVMLLHVNRINRDFGDDILAYFKQKGYGFITLAQAYEDPIYAEPDCWVGPNGISWLERVRLTRLGNLCAGS